MTMNVQEWLGPQYGRDNAFTARMRRHQSWWRAVVLRAEMGVGPKEKSANLYGNYLDGAAADQGDNFLTRQIHREVLRRIDEGAGVERYRCLHNLLSSQPMCFNLFGPLRGDPDLASSLIDAAVPGEVGAVEDVTIEYAPSPASEYLGDRTSFDAFVAYRHAADSRRAFLAIETKLTEPFSQKTYGLDDRPAYRRLTESADGPWRGDAGDRVTDLRWNQLWRNQLLSESLVRSESDGFDHYVQVVVHHPDDPDVAAAIEGYRQLLNDQDSLVALDLRAVVDAWRPLLDGERRRWIDRFDTRYLQHWLSDAWHG